MNDHTLAHFLTHLTGACYESLPGGGMKVTAEKVQVEFFNERGPTRSHIAPAFIGRDSQEAANRLFEQLKTLSNDPRAAVWFAGTPMRWDAERQSFTPMSSFEVTRRALGDTSPRLAA